MFLSCITHRRNLLQIDLGQNIRILLCGLAYKCTIGQLLFIAARMQDFFNPSNDAKNVSNLSHRRNISQMDLGQNIRIFLSGK